MSIEPQKISFSFLVNEKKIEVVYTFTGEWSSGHGLRRPVYQVAVFNNTDGKGKPMGTYWGCINKTNAISYVKNYIKP